MKKYGAAVQCGWSDAVIKVHVADNRYRQQGRGRVLKMTDYCQNCLREIITVETSDTTVSLPVWVRIATFKEWP